MRILAALAALLMAGCWTRDGMDSTTQVLLPGVPPIVIVSPDSLSNSCPCSAGQANLTIAGITGGSLRIEIRDDAGDVVHDNRYDGGLVGAISAITAPGGAPGDWRVAFTFTAVAAIGAVDLDADLFDQPDDIVIAGAYALDSTYEYEAGWPSGPASVTMASAISLGTVRIRMWDAAGTLVLDRTNVAIFVGAFNGESLPGEAGTWRIRIDIDAVATAGAITIDHP